MQIVCEFDFFNKLLINLKFSQNLRIVKTWSNFFLLLFLKLFAAHSLLENYVMRRDSDFSHKSCLRVLVLQQITFDPNMKKDILFEVIFAFSYFFRFFYMCIVCWGLISWKNVLLLLVYFPLQKSLVDLVMTSPGLIMTLHGYCFCLEL